MMKICDLHTHSIFSDGTFTPEELIDAAIERGLSALALTDHNTVSGLDRFLSYGTGKPIELVPGIELSTEYDGQELHILGLFLKPEMYNDITAYVKEADMRKEISNLSLAQKLNENGFPVDYAALKAAQPDGKVNRAHFAAALVEAGYCKSRNEAFDTILSKSYGWYQPPKRLDAFETIALLQSLGAVPVWAHPLFHVGYEQCEVILSKAKPFGLAGIETVYSTYSEADERFAKRMCRKFTLLESGGSDFHGKNKPDISLGTGRGNLKIPYAFFEKLKERAKSRSVPGTARCSCQ